MEHRAGARKYAGSLQWLYDAGIINFCHNLEAISLPLEGNAIDNNFKVYLRDTGLLVAMLEDGSQADIFAKQGRRLYFLSTWSRTVARATQASATAPRLSSPRISPDDSAAPTDPRVAQKKAAGRKEFPATLSCLFGTGACLATREVRKER